MSQVEAFVGGDVVMVSVVGPTDLMIMWKTTACPSLATVLGFRVKVINMGAMNDAYCTVYIQDYLDIRQLLHILLTDYIC